MFGTFYILVIAFGLYDPKCADNRFCRMKAEPPFVGFYWAKSKVQKDLEVMPSRVDTAKVFQVSCNYDGCDVVELEYKPTVTLVNKSTHAFDKGF